MATADVTVMGAGVFGLSIAFVCAMRGANVQVIDPLGVAAGASGGIVGALAPHVPEQWNAKKQFQFESLLMAEGFWRTVEAKSGAEAGYRRSGRLQPLADDHAVGLAQGRAASSKEVWRGEAVWEVIPQGGGDWMPPSASGMVIHDTLSALIHPRHATRALAAAVTALGGTIVAQGDVAGKVVDATGWHGLGTLSAAHGRLVGNGVKGQAALLEFDARGAPQLFIDGMHFVPHSDGTVAIGSTTEREFDDGQATDAALEGLIVKARRALPALADARVLERWAGVRPRSRSRAPMLGPHPWRTDTFIANGGFKIGFGMAPKVAHVMADLVLDGRDVIPDDFRVERSL